MSKPEGVARVETLAYRGKTYEVPIFTTVAPVVLTARPSDLALPPPTESPVLRCLHSIWSLAEFGMPRRSRIRTRRIAGSRPPPSSR